MFCQGRRDTKKTSVKKQAKKNFAYISRRAPDNPKMVVPSIKFISSTCWAENFCRRFNWLRSGHVLLFYSWLECEVKNKRATEKKISSQNESNVNPKKLLQIGNVKTTDWWNLKNVMAFKV